MNFKIIILTAMANNEINMLFNCARDMLPEDNSTLFKIR